MWVKISNDVFQKEDFKSINSLYQILSWYPSNSDSPRYNILVDTESVKSYENFQKLSTIENSLISFLDLEFTNFINSPSPPNYTVSSLKKTNHFTVEEANFFFKQSVSIILENNKNDSLLVETIINLFCGSSENNIAKNHLENTWIKFENAGGCSNIPNFLEGFLRQFKKLAERNNRQASDYFRGIIIIDSDREYQGQTSKHEKLLQKISSLGVNKDDVHILQKRMMENYLPKIAYEELKRQKAVYENVSLTDWLHAYLNMSSTEHYDFINIPEGNLHGNTKPTPTELLTLWDNTNPNFQKLNTGFKYCGFNEFGQLKNGSFKDEFPNLFRKHMITKEVLEERDGCGELQAIADKIMKLL